MSVELNFKKIYVNPKNKYQEETQNIFPDEFGNMFLKEENTLTKLIPTFKEINSDEKVWSKKVKELGINLEDTLTLTSRKVREYSQKIDGAWHKIDVDNILFDTDGRAYLFYDDRVVHLSFRDVMHYYVNNKKIGNKYFTEKVFGIKLND